VSHEAILFDVIVVVAGLGSFCSISIVFLFIFRALFQFFYLLFLDEMNGKNDRDFPIPDEFRVSRDVLTGRWNYTQLAGAIVKGMSDYDSVLPQVTLCMIVLWMFGFNSTFNTLNHSDSFSLIASSMLLCLCQACSHAVSVLIFQPMYVHVFPAF
jgi:hypothetical protein